MSFFPPLPENAVFALDLILKRLAEDPEFLDDEDCPYTSEEKDFLSKFVAEISEVEEAEAELGNKWDRLERESNSLFKNLTETGATLQIKDHTEKMAYFRTATSLLDKIVSIQERTANLRQIHKFHETVLNIMEDTLDAEQRTAVMERLQQSITPKE